MKAFILAAGLGTRMRPLTDTTPKPLLKAGGKALIDYHIERLAEAGIKDIVINTAHLGEQIEAHLGNGKSFGVQIQYSREDQPLETGGAITHALNLLGSEPFLLVNGDVFTDFPFSSLIEDSLNEDSLIKNKPDFAHLILVPIPAFKSQGDFGLDNGLLKNAKHPKYTYAGIGVYNPHYFQQFDRGDSFALGPLLKQEAEHGRVSAQLYQGLWMDIGTPERLAELDTLLKQQETN